MDEKEKLEYFAAMAMQGLLANISIIDRTQLSHQIDHVSLLSVKAAKALLTELEKEE